MTRTVPNGGLLDEIRKAAPPAGCLIKTIVIPALTEDDVLGLISALGDDTLRASTVAQVLRNRGFAISDDTVQRHRRGKCSCSRGAGRG